ncbi:protein of unknown function DUF195 [Acidimicrobium ferrooxidans DSM 10331]|uniref:DNA recombination protein RmuC n=1 Tax=Acidimicrobium ferrooxidans (strain DSM 10331 / JCM 15462 / NBRC 103882 / ICP) TaxID=525909 RepID=C7M2A7_ACIFD|nr:DNA recombination protein RmuC [Acidimicrobium ferrooxidans]ACU54896.1 protein of unknown function DUF195 [Acidimicrobium ferrooxidans DSM 10331]
MIAVLAFCVGLLLGALTTALVLLRRLGDQRAAAADATRTLETQLVEARTKLAQLEPQRLAEQTNLGPLLDQAQRSVEETVKRVVAEHLDHGSEQAIQKATALLDKEFQPRLASLEDGRKLLLESADTLRKLVDEQLRSAREQITTTLRASGSEAATQLSTTLTERMDQLKQLAASISEQLANDQRLTGTVEESLRSFVAENQELRTRVHELTQALQRSPKQRGNWGELVLENLLVGAGLTQHRDFDLQVAFRDDDGRTVIADAIINLPGERHLVIDAKVQLVDYLRAVEDPANDTAARAHAEALRRQINELADHRYDRLVDGALDGTFLFVPIESALALALETDPALMELAIGKGIFLATPTTLIPVLKLVGFLWRGAERDSRAEEAERLARRLADKIASFAESFLQIDKGLQVARNAYERAEGQLRSGRGNAMALARRLGEVSGRSGKALPAPLEPFDDAGDDASDDDLASSLEEGGS